SRSTVSSPMQMKGATSSARSARRKVSRWSAATGGKRAGKAAPRSRSRCSVSSRRAKPRARRCTMSALRSAKRSKRLRARVTAAEQTEQVFANLKAVLSAAGTSLAQVVKTTVYLADMADFAQMNEVYAKHFGAHKPARSTVQAAGLPKAARVEIDVIAVTQ